MKKISSIVCCLLFVVCCLLVSTKRCLAACDFPPGANTEELEKRQTDCVSEIDKTQNQILDYNQQINLMDNRVKLTSIKILQTEKEVNNLEKEIASLSGKIVRLDTSLDFLSKALLSRIVETYKVGRSGTAQMLFSTKSFSNFIGQYHYLKSVQSHDRQLLLTMEQTRMSYDEQKTLKQQAQDKLEKLQVQLNRDKIILAKQKKEKEELLAQTQNNKRRYENILAQVMAEIASYKGFTQKQTGGILPPQNSPDGWYYSQRDSRWASNLIGYSRENILDVGCLIASVAMVNTFYGNRVFPADIAGNPEYFYLQTAYMKMDNWRVPAGKSVSNVSGGLTGLDKELAENHPVIVHLRIGGDGHFVVIKKKEGSDYIMHDPWEGYDKKLTDYYSLGNINTGNMRVIK